MRRRWFLCWRVWVPIDVEWWGCYTKHGTFLELLENLVSCGVVPLRIVMRMVSVRLHDGQNSKGKRVGEE